MTDDANMRLRLQNVAAYRELCRGVQRSGRENVVFALIMLGLAYFSYSAGASLLIVALYAALATGELLVGLFKWVFPSAEGVLLDALVLLAFAGWNIGWQGLALAVNQRPNPVILFLGLYMLFGAFGRFKAYASLRTLFADRPAPNTSPGSTTWCARSCRPTRTKTNCRSTCRPPRTGGRSCSAAPRSSWRTAATPC